MYTTPFRKTSHGYVTATFGLRRVGEQAPHMSVTGTLSARESRRERDVIAYGQICSDVLEAFPELAPVQRWHLCTDGIPIHYIDNARYWWEAAHHVRTAHALDPDPRATFAIHCMLGILGPEDEHRDLIEKTWPEVKAALESRIPELQRAYRELVSTLPDLAAQLGARKE